MSRLRPIPPTQAAQRTFSLIIHIHLNFFNLAVSTYHHPKIMYVFKYFSLSLSHLATLIVFTSKWLRNVNYNAVSTSFPFCSFQTFSTWLVSSLQHWIFSVLIIKGHQVAKHSGHSSVFIIFKLSGVDFTVDIHLSSQQTLSEFS